MPVGAAEPIAAVPAAPFVVQKGVAFLCQALAQLAPEVSTVPLQGPPLVVCSIGCREIPVPAPQPVGLHGGTPAGAHRLVGVHLN